MTRVRQGQPVALTASADSFVVVTVEKSKFSLKSAVYKVEGLTEVFFS